MFMFLCVLELTVRESSYSCKPQWDSDKFSLGWWWRSGLSRQRSVLFSVDI